MNVQVGRTANHAQVTDFCSIEEPYPLDVRLCAFIELPNSRKFAGSLLCRLLATEARSAREPSPLEPSLPYLASSNALIGTVVRNLGNGSPDPEPQRVLDGSLGMWTSMRADTCVAHRRPPSSAPEPLPELMLLVCRIEL